MVDVAVPFDQVIYWPTGSRRQSRGQDPFVVAAGDEKAPSDGVDIVNDEFTKGPVAT